MADFTDKRVYWIWLQHAFGAGSAKPFSIHKRFNGDLEAFHNAGPSLWNTMEFISEKEARMLMAYSIKNAEIMLEMHLKMGIGVITPDCFEYPELLKNIYNPPAVLYYKGRMLDVDNNLSIGIVGTRKPQKRSIEITTSLSYQLALSRAFVVSGVALGIDTAAHKGALRGMGSTICVLPCGITNGYLVENYALRGKVAASGTLITEYPMDTAVTKGSFQPRNRIISGLSHGTLIVEAPKRSGALITAKHAKEQDRDVFVVPSDGSLECEGNEALLRDGAKPVQKIEDILSEYELRFSKMSPQKRAETVTIVRNAVTVMSDSTASGAAYTIIPKELWADCDKLLDFLSDGDKLISVIAEEMGKDTADTSSLLTQLEIEGLVESLSGGRYKRV